MEYDDAKSGRQASMLLLPLPPDAKRAAPAGVQLQLEPDFPPSNYERLFSREYRVGHGWER